MAKRKDESQEEVGASKKARDDLDQTDADSDVTQGVFASLPQAVVDSNARKLSLETVTRLALTCKALLPKFIEAQRFFVIEPEIVYRKGVLTFTTEEMQLTEEEFAASNFRFEATELVIYTQASAEVVEHVMKVLDGRGTVRVLRFALRCAVTMPPNVFNELLEKLHITELKTVTDLPPEIDNVPALKNLTYLETWISGPQLKYLPDSKIHTCWIRFRQPEGTHSDAMNLILKEWADKEREIRNFRLTHFYGDTEKIFRGWRVVWDYEVRRRPIAPPLVVRNHNRCGNGQALYVIRSDGATLKFHYYIFGPQKAHYLQTMEPYLSRIQRGQQIEVEEEEENEEEE